MGLLQAAQWIVGTVAHSEVGAHKGALHQRLDPLGIHEAAQLPVPVLRRDDQVDVH